MKTLFILLLVVSQLFAVVSANEEYVVKKGDVISRVVKDHYPNDKLYGSRGKIVEVLKNNPHIKNADLVYPQQKIKLNMATDTSLERVIITDHAEEPIADVDPSEHVQTTDEKIDGKWKVAFYYGAKDLSVTQEGALGKGDVGVLYFNYLRLHTEYEINKWAWGFQYDTFNLRYRALGKTKTNRMNGLFLYGSYNWLLAGLHFDQTPLFKNSGTEVSFYKMTPAYLSLGARKDFDLKWSRPATLAFKGWFGYPLTVLSESSDVSLSSSKGYSLNAQMELNYQIWERPSYSMYATWYTGVAHKNLDQKVESGASKGSVQTKILDVSTNVGLLFKF